MGEGDNLKPLPDSVKILIVLYSIQASTAVEIHVAAKSLRVVPVA